MVKTQGILFAQVVNSIFLNSSPIIDSAIFVSKILQYPLESGYIYQVSFVYVAVTSHVNSIGTGKICGQTGKTQGL